MNIQRHLRTASHHVTWIIGTRASKLVPLVFVVGYPKSGTTWVAQLVADYLQLPFPRFSLLPVGCPAVFQGHQRVSKSYPRGVYVLRDGRDAVLSAYFAEARAIPEGDHPRMTAPQRRMFPGLVNKANVRDNIAGFLERQMKRPHASPVNWADHVRSYFEVNHPNVVLLQYEALIREGETALAKAMSDLTGEEVDLEAVRSAMTRYSFRRQAGRRPGLEGADWLRKGQTGDWANHFTRQAAEAFDHHCGDMLIAAGYESDRSWVSSLPTGARPPAPA